MKISELMRQLQVLATAHGDLRVCIADADEGALLVMQDRDSIEIQEVEEGSCSGEKVLVLSSDYNFRMPDKAQY